MALTNMDKRRPNLFSKRERTVERERREGEKKNKRKRRRGEAKPKRYGTTWAFKALNGFPCHCMVISCPQT